MDLIVRQNSAHWGNAVFPCFIGKSGTSLEKVEGDGTTPCGAFPFRCVYYRADRLPPPITSLPTYPLSQNSGWCDDVNHPLYNHSVTLPFEGKHEKLWREDAAYDIILVVGYNDAPVVLGKGSAVFVHLMSSKNPFTEGCVAFDLPSMLEILRTAKCQSHLVVEC